MILESKIDIPANVFGVEFSQVSIEVEEPIVIHAGILTRLLFNNSYLGSEHMVMMNVLENEDGSYEVRAAGPTTSIREEPYQWEVMRDHGIVGVIGKGGMGPKTLKGNQDYGCVYFHAIGGAAQVLAEKILSVDNVYLKEKFGSPEAIWELSVDEFPVVVTMDAHGNSLHEKVESESKQKLNERL